MAIAKGDEGERGETRRSWPRPAQDLILWVTSLAIPSSGVQSVCLLAGRRYNRSGRSISEEGGPIHQVSPLARHKMGNRWPKVAYRLSLQKPAFTERASLFLGT